MSSDDFPDAAVIATVRFPAPAALRLSPGQSVETAYTADIIDLLRERIAIAGDGRPVEAQYTEAGTWRSRVPAVAEMLNLYFGREARVTAFPTMPSEPIAAFADAVARLFGARVEWTPRAQPGRADLRRTIH